MKRKVLAGLLAMSMMFSLGGNLVFAADEDSESQSGEEELISTEKDEDENAYGGG